MDNVRELFQIFTRRYGFLNKNCCSIEGEEISTIHSHILYEINRKPQSSMQEVAATLGTDITTFSRQIQNLIKMDLVKKHPHPEDRRVQILSLTPKGRVMTDAIDHQMKEYFQEVFSHMNEKEKEMVLNSVKLLNDAMAKSTSCCQVKLD